MLISVSKVLRNPPGTPVFVTMPLKQEFELCLTWEG